MPGRRATRGRAADPFNRGDRYTKPGVAEAVDAYLQIARDFGLDPAQLAIAYVTSRPFVTANIIGATRPDQLEADLRSVEVRITPEIEARINDVFQRHGSPAP
ncbi:aldo/keto reductase [Paracoccus kondratievae]